MNNVFFIGNWTKDGELIYSGSGNAIYKNSIAVNKKYKDKITGEIKENVLFIDVVAFSKKGELANQFTKKGSKVAITGSLQLERWVDNNGQNRSKHSVIAEQLQFLDSKDDNQSSINQGYNENRGNGAYGGQAYDDNGYPNQNYDPNPKQGYQNHNENVGSYHNEPMDYQEEIPF